jgi:hypothetical protein
MRECILQLQPLLLLDGAAAGVSDHYFIVKNMQHGLTLSSYKHVRATCLHSHTTAWHQSSQRLACGPLDPPDNHVSG